jgi:hypothetical protein
MILIKKRVMTEGEWTKALLDEAMEYEKHQQKDWPEVKVAEDGRSLAIDTQAATARIAEEEWPP